MWFKLFLTYLVQSLSLLPGLAFVCDAAVCSFSATLCKSPCESAFDPRFLMFTVQPVGPALCGSHQLRWGWRRQAAASHHLQRALQGGQREALRRGLWHRRPAGDRWDETFKFVFKWQGVNGVFLTLVFSALSVCMSHGPKTANQWKTQNSSFFDLDFYRYTSTIRILYMCVCI